MKVMNNLNSILIEGNMIRDPLFRQNSHGTWITTFTLASSRYFKNGGEIEKEVCFFDVESVGKLAESCARMGRKGRGLRAVGRLRQDRRDGTDGKPRSRIIISAEHVEFRPEAHSNSLGGYTEEELSCFNENVEVPPEEEMVDESVLETQKEV
jgi:single-strand DNA-binding protein